MEGELHLSQWRVGQKQTAELVAVDLWLTWTLRHPAILLPGVERGAALQADHHEGIPVDALRERRFLRNPAAGTGQLVVPLVGQLVET